MKLKVTLHEPGALNASRNVLITADATATAGDVAAALLSARRGTEVPSDSVTLRVVSGAGGRVLTLPPTQLLVDSDLRSGATVELARPDGATGPAQGTPAVAVLRVLDGPETGREFHLPQGVFTIGRSESCDIVLKDPLVSADHARLRIGDRVELVDNRSSNGVLVGGVHVGRVELRAGDAALVGNTLIAIDPLHVREEVSTTSTDILFVRSPRVLRRPARREVDLPEVPRDIEPTRFPYLAMAAPLVMGLVMFTLSRNPLSVAFVALSPILMVGNWIDQRYRGARMLRAATQAFEADLAEVQTRLGDLGTSDREALHELYPPVADCVRAALSRTDLLWSRRPEHPEFLQIRLGTGSVPAFHLIKEVRSGGKPELTAKARRLAEQHARLDQAPVVADLRSVGGLGLCGDRRQLIPLARAVAAQVAALHSPSEVVITCLTSTEGRGRWAWLEWLPHVASPHSPVPGHHLSSDAGSGLGLLANLEEVVEQRRTGASGAVVRGPLGDGQERLGFPVVPSVVVIVDDASADRARLTRVAERGPDVGVHVIWVARDRGALPAACRAFVDVRGAGADVVGLVRAGVELGGISAECLDADTATAVGRSLTPLVDAGAPVDDESDLPRGISVVTLFGAGSCDDADAVLTRWHENRSLVPRDGRVPDKLDKPSSLRALVGHAGTHEFALDLRTHGPHALVGGTTGAGKSEFLQAWVLGLAHAYSPDRVTFLFVDYKGGAAFAKLTALPHYVGMVTDLDTYLVRRVLRSLRAELRHREKLLSERSAKDLLELERSGDPECPPSLVIVVDEFAALVKEIPEFVDGVVDIAQRGRSLGLHLILATQRPAGVIKENLRANTNLRVALRMADESESLDVLGDRMAAHFDPSVPGRAAAKTGPGRITPFQSAFPGARTPAVFQAPPIDVTELDFGVGQPWSMPERAQVSEAIPQDVERVVASVAEAARRGRVRSVRRPWLDPLAACYNLNDLGQVTDAELVLGMMDDPDEQRQVTEHFRPDQDGNILFVGGGGSGKSTALRSLAVAASITPCGGPVHLYGLDFAGGALADLDRLPTVGAVVPGDDGERVARLLRLIGGIVEDRGPRMKAARADALARYRQSHPCEPRILLLLDGFTNFRSELEGSTTSLGLYQLFQRILAEGRGAGVHVAMTADRPSAVPTSVNASFRRKVVLRMADEAAYTAMSVPKDILKPASPPGRAIQVDNPNELQLAVVGPDPNVGAQAREIEGLAKVLAEHVVTSPAPVRSLPTVVLTEGLPASVGGRPTLGIADSDLRPMGFDPAGVFLLAGPSGSGRTNAVRWLAESLRAQPSARTLVHLSPRPSPLSPLGIWASSARTMSEVQALVERIKPFVEIPADHLPESLAVFVESYTEFVGSPAESIVLDLVKQCRRNGHFLVAEGETTTWGSPWPMVMEVRNARTGLLLTPDQVDGDNLMRTSLPRVRRADLPPGRGFLVRAGTATKVQIPWVE
jgi:S-DNA-T family DNA segregation ATPase FtsK/SpoIIIE